MVIIPHSILSELKKIKGSVGYLLTGSRVLGKISKNSDWDVFVILQNDQKPWRKTYKVENEWLELICNTVDHVKSEFKENRSSGRGVTTYMFKTGQIIRDDKFHTLTNLIEEARKIWNKGPRHCTKKELNWIGYDIATYIQDLEDCILDDIESTLIANYALNEFVMYFYRLANVWQPRAKDVLNDFLKRDQLLASLLDKINHTFDWKLKSEMVIKFGQRLSDYFSLNTKGDLYIAPVKK